MSKDLGELATKLTLDNKEYMSSVKESEKGLDGFVSGVNKFGSIAGTVLKSVTIAFAAVEAATIGVAVALVKMSERGGEIEEVTDGFARSFGDAEKALNSMRKASSGMISGFRCDSH